MTDDNEKTEINITSNNQMGGITAHTVNFGSQARQMNDRLGSQLKKMIPTGAKVKVTAVLGNAEAYGLANQVLQWLKSNGYENAAEVDQAVYSAQITGQSINKKAENEFEIIIGSMQ